MVGIASVLLLLYCGLSDAWVGLPFVGAFLAIGSYVLQEVQSGPVRISFSAGQWSETEEGTPVLEIHRWAFGVRSPAAGVYRYFPETGRTARVYAEPQELPNGNLLIVLGNGEPFDGEVRIAR